MDTMAACAPRSSSKRDLEKKKRVEGEGSGRASSYITRDRKIILTSHRSSPLLLRFPDPLPFMMLVLLELYAAIEKSIRDTG